MSQQIVELDDQRQEIVAREVRLLAQRLEIVFERMGAAYDRGPLVSEIRQGQVYWLDFGPAAGSAPAERRPFVVVQNDVFNRSAIATSVVCVITSNLRRANAPGNVLLKKREA